VESMSKASLDSIRNRAQKRLEDMEMFEREYNSISPELYLEHHLSPGAASAMLTSRTLSGGQDTSRGINVLMCGWRRDVKDMLRLMDKCLPRGSSVHILCEKSTEEVEEYLRDHCHNLRSMLSRICVMCVCVCYSFHSVYVKHR
jgi:hypothetical protein